MRLKRPDNDKDSRIDMRLSSKVKNKLQAKANIYTEGDLTEYMIYAGLNFVPDKDDLEEERKSAPRKVRR